MVLDLGVQQLQDSFYRVGRGGYYMLDVILTYLEVHLLKNLHYIVPLIPFSVFQLASFWLADDEDM